MTIKPLAFVVVLCVAAASTGAQSPQDASKPSRISGHAKTTRVKIDLSKIDHIAPKGRVQDKDYNDLVVVDQLIANGKDSIPYLINKLDDKTVIHKPLEDFWPELTVGDVALLILSDFSLDSTWMKSTIPGASWDELFEARKDPNTPFSEYYKEQIRKHGRAWVKARWQKIWTTYKDRIVWDDKERCFRVV